jgi:predicted transcriptional regulator YdeE
VFVPADAALGASMKPPTKEIKEFQVMGIAVRTSNAKEMTTGGEIPKQWQEFFQEGILSKIPHKVDSTIYAVYADYANCRDGEYTFLIGAKVNHASDVPDGMVVKTVPGGQFAIITSEKGPVERVVPQAWQRIWQLEKDAQLGGKSACRADFEVYDERSHNPRDAQVDIYIGLDHS